MTASISEPLDTLMDSVVDEATNEYQTSSLVEQVDAGVETVALANVPVTLLQTSPEKREMAPLQLSLVGAGVEHDIVAVHPERFVILFEIN